MTGDGSTKCRNSTSRKLPVVNGSNAALQTIKHSVSAGHFGLISATVWGSLHRHHLVAPQQPRAASVLKQRRPRRCPASRFCANATYQSRPVSYTHLTLPTNREV